MSLIKIIANGIELDYVKESLTLKEDNNGFNSSFKVKHNNFPFLIIENENAKLTLGSNDITSLSKKKIIEVEIYELDEKYYGQIRQLSFIDGFRKCDLKYGSDLLKITNKKIGEFMPVVSVIPDETTPVPYTEKSDSEILGYENWETYPQQFLDLEFPDAKWQFPTMKWYNKFGIDLPNTDKWYNFVGEVNTYEDSLTSFPYNYHTPNHPNSFNVTQKWVPSLQVYLLSPLLYALQEIGYSADGNFYSHEFVKRLLILSSKDNLCESTITTDLKIYSLENDFIFNTWLNEEATNFFLFSSLDPGIYYLEYTFELKEDEPSALYYSIVLNINDSSDYQLIFSEPSPTDHLIKTGVVEFEITTNVLFKMAFTNENQVFPYSNSFTLRQKEGPTYMQFHPTIETGRYLPDWTFAKYLNEIQKTFNLEIVEDTFRKKITLNFIEEEYFESLPLVLDKTFKIDAKDIVSNNSFVLKYKNNTDLGLIISQDSINTYNGEKPEFSTIIDLEFKEVDYNSSTATLSEDLIEKDGVGLMVYDPTHKPFVKNNWSSFNLSISLDGGIFKTFYKKTLKIRLLSSGIEIKGAFTKTELAKIKKSKTIYFDNQKFIIISYDFTETSDNYFSVKMKLETVNY